MLQSSVSGLQRLFSSALSSVSPHKLESCIEDAHTYDLLFPGGVRHGDPTQYTGVTSSADERGGLDICPRDVRIVIAQDATGPWPAPKTVLYDSHPPTIPTPQAWSGLPTEAASRRQRAGSLGGLTGGGLRSKDSQKPRTAPHSRQSSFSQVSQPGVTSLTSPLSSVNELGGLFGNGEEKTFSARPATRDGETEALLDCMFGKFNGVPSTSGTKLHIRPPKSTPNSDENRPGSRARDPSSPVAFPKRRTPLTRSTTASELQNESDNGARPTPRPDSGAIWITRLFCVDLMDSAIATAISKESSLLEQIRIRDTDRPKPGSLSPTSTKKAKANQIKTPMYAIAMVLHMPHHRQRPQTPSSNRSCGYSAGSTPPWPLNGSSGSNAYGLEPNDDLEYVMAHRSVIDRALSELEIVALSTIRDALCKVVLNPGHSEGDSIKRSGSGSIVSTRKPKRPSQQTLELPAGVLQRSTVTRDMADRTGNRIALALKMRKVVTGQGRWDAWRHELRWVDKRANGRESNFFFFNLLTAYLASHTRWLQVLAPDQYRRRYAKMARDDPNEDNSIRHRTVIVSSDKMGSRRLIFLLSMFLPGSHSNLSSDPPVQYKWPSLGRSESPRSSGQIGRQHILGKTSERTRNDPAYGNTILHSNSKSSSDAETRLSAKYPTEGQSTIQISQGGSDVRSVGSVALLINSDGSATRKSSTTTTATIKAESAVPVAHFASHLNDALMDGPEGSRPSSSDSLAPRTLQRALYRSDSNEYSTASTDSPPRSAWGSLSKIWGGRRGSSTELASSEEGLGISGISRSVGRQRMVPTLDQSVGEVQKAKVQCYKISTNHGTAEHPPSQASLGISPQKYMHDMLAPFPLKLSVDEKDGLVDVDLPQASLSSVSSPIAVRTAASSFTDRISLNGRTQRPVSPYPDPGTAGYVSGWLRSYHPDLSLQGVRPYDGLKDQIIRSMRSTPSPTSGDDSSTDEWSEICSTLIADCSNYTITRLSLRRKNATSLHHRIRAVLENPVRDVSSEEQIIEEPLMDMDPTLTDAVEKVISHSGESSRVASRAPSPTRRRNHNLTVESPGLELPHGECAKTVLGALEQVARTVYVEMTAQDQSSHAPGKAGRNPDLPEEGILRQGIYKWFREVDGYAT